MTTSEGEQGVKDHPQSTLPGRHSPLLHHLLTGSLLFPWLNTLLRAALGTALPRPGLHPASRQL